MQKQQRGAVLLIGIILLLVITIIGVSAVSMSSIKTQVAGNSMFTMLTYQGAESALVKSLSPGSEKSMKEAMKKGIGVSYQLPSNYFTTSSESVSGGATLSQRSSVTALGSLPCPLTEVAYGVGNCYIFETDAQARLVATGARARHIEGRSTQVLRNFD